MSGSPRILVVDDQQDILELTEAVLSAEGYRISKARSGTEALRRLGGESFELVLLDINMPEMDGWETLRLIRADDQLRELPVAMFSVKGDLHDKIQGLQEGALDYITKPFIVDDLVSRVRKLLESKERGGPQPSLGRPVS